MNEENSNTFGSENAVPAENSSSETEMPSIGEPEMSEENSNAFGSENTAPAENVSPAPEAPAYVAPQQFEANSGTYGIPQDINTSYFSAPEPPKTPKPPKPPVAPVPPASPRKRWWTGGKIVGFIAIILAALLLGVWIGSTIVAPLISAFGSNRQTQPQTQDEKNFEDILPNNRSGDKSEDAFGIESQPEASVIHPHTLPKLGGIAPYITSTYNPVPEIAESLSPSVVGVVTYNKVLNDNKEEEREYVGRGSGFVVTADGYIVTNHHVMSSAKYLSVVMIDGTEYDAVAIGSDPMQDVAVLKIEPDEPLTPLALGDSDATRVGEMAIAIGNPEGIGENLVGTVTVGYVGATDREITFNQFKQKFIQMDTAINPGNSGGPLVNESGEVIGIVTLKSLISSVDEYGQPVSTEGIGFAIPINQAMRSVESIILTGCVARPGLGIEYYEMGREDSGLDYDTVYEIASFLANSPCEKAGMQVGDVIIAADGKPLPDSSTFTAGIKARNIGDEVTFTVLRGDKKLDIKVTLVDLNKTLY